MIQYLIQSQNTIRVETKEDANALHAQYEKYASDNGFVLSAWSQTLKERKSQGEVIESYYLCKVTLVFNDAKDPDVLLSSVDYNMIQPTTEPTDDTEGEG